MKEVILILITILTGSSYGQTDPIKDPFNTANMIIRISEIEIEPAFLNEYLSILKEESAASVMLEQGVISIYPMFVKNKPTEIRILEIYADQAAYESHLQTPNFKQYKAETLGMVKSLKLIDMEAVDKETMPKIFKKLKSW